MQKMWCKIFGDGMGPQDYALWIMTRKRKPAVTLTLTIFCFPFSFQMIATAIVVGITLHAGNHLACDFPRVINSGPDQYRWVEPDFGPIRPTYTSLLTGIEGDFWIDYIRSLLLLLLLLMRYWWLDLIDSKINWQNI